MKLTKQQKQIYDYIKANPGTTIREIRHNTFPAVQKPCMRLAEMEKTHGISFERIGRNKHREMMYRISNPVTKRVQRTEMTDYGVRVWYEEVPI